MTKQKDSEYQRALAKHEEEIKALENKWNKEKGGLVKKVVTSFETRFDAAMGLLEDVPTEENKEVLKLKGVKKFLKRFGNGNATTKTTKTDGARTSTKGVTDEMILEFLATGEKSSKELQEKFGWTTSASVGQRMKPLIEADKVTMRQGKGTGRPKFYSLKA